MKALSIRHPWAWLIIHGGKDIENRSWHTKHRGRFLVHAAKGMTGYEYADAYNFCKVNGLALPPSFEELKRDWCGGIIGSVFLADSRDTSVSPWYMGEKAFLLIDPKPLPFRRRGLSIDGNNIYKRDVCDLIVGALACGAQNRNSPPLEHWARRFWDIGREERMTCEELAAALGVAVERWGLLASELKHTTSEYERELAEISKARDAIAKATR